jgi:hypothetical protein
LFNSCADALVNRLPIDSILLSLDAERSPFPITFAAAALRSYIDLDASRLRRDVGIVVVVGVEGEGEERNVREGEGLVGVSSSDIRDRLEASRGKEILLL